jgi:DNA polymerase-3 subunit alpha
MSALKGVGEGPVEEILEERKNGTFKSLFEMLRRLPMKAVNKKALESLALGGAFDCFEGTHGAQYFAPSDKYETLLEHAIKFASAVRATHFQPANSLFGDRAT